MSSLHKMSREQICGMNFHYKHHSFEYFLDAMVRFGFRNLELWGASPHVYVDTFCGQPKWISLGAETIRAI